MQQQSYTKHWLLRKRDDDALMPKDFGSSIGISSRCASILWERGMSCEDKINKFLSPHLRYLEQPGKWPDINKAATLIATHLLEGKKLAVWGDYDVDGVTGVSIVIEVLRHYGFFPLWHLPERVSEGYGLNEKYIEKLANDGANILLTVDCGISNVKEVQKALDLNMVVIISDHHLSPEQLPNAHALCNPRLADCPCDSLAGVGVVFFLMAEVNTILSEKLQIEKFAMRQCLDLVALGTLADMVPLEGQNRILVKNGLLQIKTADRIGLAALKSVSNHNVQDELSPRQVVFSLAPRINAAGRMASAGLGVELFTCVDKNQALKVAHQLDQHNEARRKEEKQITEQALALAEEQIDSPVLFVHQEDWNQGIVGIVASRLVEKYYKPSFVFCKDGEVWKASARSIKGFDLHSGLDACSEYLQSFGGHKMAAGLRVEPSQFEAFKEAFKQYFNSTVDRTERVRKVLIDGELNFEEVIDSTFRKEIFEMQPFGIGNDEPVFSSPALMVNAYSCFGAKKNHVKLVLHDLSTGITLTVKVWSQADNYPSAMLNKKIQIAYSPNIESGDTFFNDYIKIRDWRYYEESQ